MRIDCISTCTRAAGAILLLSPALGAQSASLASATTSPRLPAAAAPVSFLEVMPFPEAIDHHVTFITSGTRGDWLHVVGGHSDGRFNNTTWKAKIASDGTVGEWARGSGLPARRAGMAYASNARFALLVGGKESSSAVTSEVYIANIWGDGRLGDWKPTSFPLPAKRFHTAAVVANNFVYVLGGNDGKSATSTVYRAKIARTGEVGVWQELAPLPGARSHHAAFVHDGAVYVVAGIAGDPAADARPLGDVLRATINEDGSLGEFRTVSTLDASFATHATVVKDGWLYVIGGVEDNQRMSDRVLRARLAADGSLGAWETVEARLPVARAHVHQVPVLREHLFSIGGSRSGRAMDDVVIGTFAKN